MTSQIQLNPLILSLQTKWHSQMCQDSSKALSKWAKLSEQLGNPIVRRSSHSLAYEITQLARGGGGVGELPTPHSMASALSSVMAHTLNSLWIWTNAPLTYHCVSHWIFGMRDARSRSQAVWVSAGLKSQKRRAEEWTGGKSSGENVLRNPLHNLPENLLTTWSVHTVFIGLILGIKKIKDRWTPHPLGQELLGPSSWWKLWDTLGSNPCQSPSAAPTAACLFMEGSRKQETVKELRFS